MNGESAFEFPEITDEDIYWAAETLGLSRTAFHGGDGCDPRQQFIKCPKSIDVAACPGSGKTTVLVAKLAILAKNWSCRTRGMCVLSHTNAARHEIERKLGSSAVGRCLLSYPHFVGTIHGFVNEFLALPYLRSFGYSGTQFNTEISGNKLWRQAWASGKLPGYFLANFNRPRDREAAIRSTHYVGEDRDLRFTVGSVRKMLHVGKMSGTYELVHDWKEAVLNEGYAAHDDTFAYGHLALAHYSLLASILRDRFPLVFVDEAQDNSEAQSVIIHRVFLEGTSAVVFQRFGDCNQAVFSSIHGEDASTYPFPIPERRHELPNSYRFGQRIADLSNPLGIQPYDSGFAGHGPCRHREAKMAECPHTVFLFEAGRATDVLDAYGQLLVETFSETVLQEGTFAAVSQVHNPPEEEEDHKKPHHVCDYWTQYDPEAARTSAMPHSLVRYITWGIAASQEKGEASLAVEQIAAGILRLASMASCEFSYRTRRYRHRYIRSLLDGSDDILGRYLDIVYAFAVERTGPNEDSWETRWKYQARAIAQALAGTSVSGDDAERFLAWNAGDPMMSGAQALQRRDNIYRYPTEAPKVEIAVGSIHSVKGQTHTATLVLESFWNDHNLESLKEWILDPSRQWKSKDGVRRKSRLKLHYVAMTRPTHLLCLAMKRSSFEEDGNLDLEQIRMLEERGWRVAQI